LKSAIVAGAIAGLVGGIVGIILMYLTLPDAVQGTMGFNASTMRWFVTQGGLNIIWGAVYGWIFSKVYDLIPRSGAMKGLIYSVMIWLFFVGLYPLSFFLIVFDPPLTQFATGLGIVGFLVRVVYGPILGTLYKK
jgi:hypothetical protein